MNWRDIESFVAEITQQETRFDVVNSVGDVKYCPYDLIDDQTKWRIPDQSCFTTYFTKHNIPFETEQDRLIVPGNVLVPFAQKADLDVKSFLRQIEINQFDLEEWYPSLHQAGMTFPCFLIPLERRWFPLIREANLRMHYRDYNHVDREELWELHEHLTRHLASMREAFPPPYFFKLNTVSPKDLPTRIGRANQAICEARLQYTGLQGSKYPQLCVSTPDEMIQLLCASDRVAHWLHHAEHTAIALRPWIPQLPHEMEFRCFFVEGRLRAASQYYWHTPVDLLQRPANCARLLAALDTYLTEHRAAIPYTTCTVDIVVYTTPRARFLTDEEERGAFDAESVPLAEIERLTVIEINPFGLHLNCGGALFNWEWDARVIYCSDPPILRVLAPQHEIRTLALDAEPTDRQAFYPNSLPCPPPG